jgi:hypothetical protein
MKEAAAPAFAAILYVFSGRETKVFSALNV